MAFVWQLLRMKRRNSRRRARVYRILVTVTVAGEGDRDWACFLLKIPSWKLIPHRKHDCQFYTYHRHTHSDPNKFFNVTPDFRLLHEMPEIIPGPSAVIGSTIYTFNILDNKLHCFDANADDPHWKTISSPTLTSEYTASPGLVALRGHLYLSRVSLLDSTSFGVIFSPESEQWREWKEADIGESRLGNKVVVASLGESSGKILVTDPWPLSFETVYDSAKGEWDPHFGSKLSSDQAEVVGNFVCVDEQHMLYWFSRDCYVSSYNWKEKEFASGPIVGLEGDYFLSGLQEDDITIPFLHFGGDLFCLLWRDSKNGEDITHIHCSIARVFKQDPPYSLAMFVVGCFRNSVHGIFHIQDAFLLH